MTSAAARTTEASFAIPRRFYPHAVNYDDQYLESEWTSIIRRTSFRPDRVALVLVDVWNTNEIGFERFDPITRQFIAPVVDAFRSAGMLVIHAPSPPVADKYPEHRFKPSADEDWLFYRQPDSWPTDDMKARRGEFAQYSLSIESEGAFRPETPADWYRNYVIHESLEPFGDERVIGDREELHALLRDQQIFHLFYCGYATNGCVHTRDYGVRAVAHLGYDITLIRDCAAALESATTLDSLEQTRASIDMMEWWISSCESREVLAALSIMRESNGSESP